MFHVLHVALPCLEQNSSAVLKASMAASVSTTIAEEIVSLVRFLHTLPSWKDMINLNIWTSLRLVKEETGMDIATMVCLCFSLYSLLVPV